jgi:integrating conjugative element protein (TIGR03761 family)
MYLSKLTIQLHSKDADLLFQGGDKTKQFIPGFRFAQNRINALLAMAFKANPYAEAALIEIDMRLDEVDTVVEDALAKAKTALKEAENDGLKLALLSRDKPFVYEVENASEYGNLLARMMVRADSAFRHIRTAHSSSYLSERQTLMFIRSLRRNVRMVFDRSASYVNKIQPDVTREDLKNKTQKGRDMIAKMGLPNEKILSGELTFRHKRIGELD